jgi:hypothetical protein
VLERAADSARSRPGDSRLTRDNAKLYGPPTCRPTPRRRLQSISSRGETPTPPSGMQGHRRSPVPSGIDEAPYV